MGAYERRDRREREGDGRLKSKGRKPQGGKEVAIVRKWVVLGVVKAWRERLGNAWRRWRKRRRKGEERGREKDVVETVV